MIPHSNSKQDVLKGFNSNAELGLTKDQVMQLQEKHGPNKLSEKKKKTTLQRFFDQFKDVMILILIAAAAVSFGVIVYEQNWG